MVEKHLLKTLSKHPQTSNLYLTVKFGLEHSQDPGSAWGLVEMYLANICTSRTFKDTLSERKIRAWLSNSCKVKMIRFARAYNLKKNIYSKCKPGLSSWLNVNNFSESFLNLTGLAVNYWYSEERLVWTKNPESLIQNRSIDRNCISSAGAAQVGWPGDPGQSQGKLGPQAGAKHHQEWPLQGKSEHLSMPGYSDGHLRSHDVSCWGEETLKAKTNVPVRSNASPPAIDHVGIGGGTLVQVLRFVPSLVIPYVDIADLQ